MVIAPSGLVLGKDGNFYGTGLGGTYGRGTIFKLTPAGVASVVHSFDPSAGDGSGPSSGMIVGSDGNFYGTTIAGGTHDAGTVFKMTPDGTASVLYSFKGYPSDSAYAAAGLFQASDGNFYGTTDFGGPYNEGTVFKLTPSGVETVLYSFGSAAHDPTSGFGALVEGDDGNFYGVSGYGGANQEGAVFKITPEGILTLVHSFAGVNDGAYPYDCGLLKARDGNFYGVASDGGPNYGGVVYKLTPAGDLTLMHAFDSSAGLGFRPEGTLVEDSLGNLYGSTQSGGYPRTVYGNHGASLTGQSGTIFEITAAGKAVQLSNFGPTDADGTNPAGPPILGQDGNLYGVTSSGGANGAGVFYKITR